MSAAEPEPSPEAVEHRFEAEVDEVLGIVINSLYSHREVFLRELLSNASDALDKRRFRALTEHDLLKEGESLGIRIAVDADAKTLSVSDDGIGMTREEMVQNLGTIARSGSKRFMEELKNRDQAEGLDLIGRFGVGFYSAFLVADQVQVTSRAAGAKESWIWTSAGRKGFRIEPGPADAPTGTTIRLHLAADHQEYLEETRLRHLVRKYSDYVGHPIRLCTDKKEELLNEAKAIWRRPKSELTQGQYEEFYKHLTHDWQAPLGHTHFVIEGTKLFTGLLFIPSEQPFDLFEREGRKGVRLYVKRVFIMDDCKELLPEWLRFVRGVIDSDDLPLNVSREVLQDEKIVRSMCKQITKKVLDLLDSIAAEKPEDWEKLWTAFGAVLKEGLHYDPDQKERIGALVRYDSTKGEMVSLDDYVGRMKPDQESIWYVVGESRNVLEGGPHIEALRRRDEEVLFMTDFVDSWAVAGLGEWKGKKLVDASRADVAPPPQDEAESSAAEERKRGLEPLTRRMTEVLAGQVAEVAISQRLIDSPCCLVIPKDGLAAHVERSLRARNKDMPRQPRILEINPEHPLVKALEGAAGRDDAEFDEWVYMLYDGALLAEGSPIADPPAYARRVTRLMTKAIGGS